MAGRRSLAVGVVVAVMVMRMTKLEDCNAIEKECRIRRMRRALLCSCIVMSWRFEVVVSPARLNIIPQGSEARLRKSDKAAS
jgi:hypothetical protein